MKQGERPFTLEADEALTHCCATCAAAPQDVAIQFGGKKHTSSDLVLPRPEEVKFAQCLDTGCQECESSANCWRGEGLRGLDIKIDAGGTFSYYRAMVTTECPVGSKAFWDLNYKGKGKLKNGYLMIEKDNDNINAAKLEEGGKQERWKSNMHTGSNKLQVDFHPDDKAKWSEAKVFLSARLVDAQFETCLDIKNCLHVLGDGSSAGFAIRNVNKNQLSCLEEEEMPDFLQATCKKWVGCLKAGGDLLEMMPSKSPTVQSSNMMVDTGKMMTTALKATSKGQQTIDFLKALLRASGAEKKSAVSKSLVQGTRLGQQRGAKECIDPAIEDPEAVECECMNAFIDACGGADETCFQRTLCAHPKICDTWKEENCASSSSMASLGVRATQTGAAQGDVDKAVQAKGGDTCN